MGALVIARIAGQDGQPVAERRRGDLADASAIATPAQS